MKSYIRRMDLNAIKKYLTCRKLRFTFAKQLCYVSKRFKGSWKKPFQDWVNVVVSMRH